MKNSSIDKLTSSPSHSAPPSSTLASDIVPAVDRVTHFGGVWRIIFLIGGLISIRQAIWLFYMRPWLGASSRLDGWFDRQQCLLPALCGPNSLYVNHAGVLFVLASLLLFTFAFWQMPTGWLENRSLSPESTRPASAMSALRPGRSRSRMTRIACGLFALFALVIVVYQAYQGMAGGEFPQFTYWGMGIVGVIAAAVMWDMDAPRLWARTLANLTVAAGIVLIVFGEGAFWAQRYDSALVAIVGGGALFVYGVAQCARVRARLQPLDYFLMLAAANLVLILAMSRAWSWRYAFVGDEWSFYDVALIIRNAPHSFLPRLFETYDPNGYHTYFSSALQTVAMELTRTNVFGWRLASVLPVAYCAPALYVVGHWLGGRTVAWLSSTLFAASHVLLSFGIVPYNNTQALLVIVVALGLYLFAHSDNHDSNYNEVEPEGKYEGEWYAESALRYLLVGLMLGMGFLVFGLGRVALVPVGVLFLWYSLPSFPRLLFRGGWIGVGWIAMAAPILFAPTAWQALLKATPLQSEVAETIPVGLQMARNSVAGLLAFIVDIHKRNSHFVLGPHTDPLTAILLLMGGGFALATLFPGTSFARRMRPWLLASALFLLAISAIQQYAWVSITRMFVAVPIYALFAGLGGVALTQLLLPAMPRLRTGLLALLAITAIGLNQFHMERISFPGSHNIWSTFPVLVGQLQRLDTLQEGTIPTFVVMDAPQDTPLKWMMGAYELEREQLVFVDIDQALVDIELDGESFGGEAFCALTTQQTVVLIPANEPLLQPMRSQLFNCWDAYHERVVRSPQGEALLYIIATAAGVGP